MVAREGSGTASINIGSNAVVIVHFSGGVDSGCKRNPG
jgi:hypothetical protein